jgi:hypothetical protein
MTMNKRTEQLPRPAAELEQIARYYDGHDTNAEMEQGEWMEPQLGPRCHPPWWGWPAPDTGRGRL